MNAKTLLALGVVISALFMYLCIDSKKDALYAQLHQEPEPIAIATPIIPTPPQKEPEAEPKPKPVPPAVIELKEPSFAFIGGTKEKIVGYFSQEDKNASIMQEIEKLCQNNSCMKEIKFFQDIKPCDFTKEASGLITYAKAERIENFALLLDKKTLSIEGKLTKQEQVETIKPYLESFAAKGYTIQNQLQKKNLKPIVKEEIIKEEVVKVAEDELVILSHLTIDEASEEINDIIMNNPINFEYRSSQLTQKSKQTLDKVVDILLGLDAVSIEVAGYTDSKGDAIYNKVLSQKRADTVRNYLIHSGVRTKLIKSVGYGEEHPISDPKDIINRRVEIHLKEGA